MLLNNINKEDYDIFIFNKLQLDEKIKSKKLMKYLNEEDLEKNAQKYIDMMFFINMYKNYKNKDVLYDVLNVSNQF